LNDCQAKKIQAVNIVHDHFDPWVGDFQMSTLSRVQEVEQQFDHLAQSGAYAKALDLVTKEQHIFPESAQKVVFPGVYGWLAALKTKGWLYGCC
jgi:hypothetical protein